MFNYNYECPTDIGAKIILEKKPNENSFKILVEDSFFKKSFTKIQYVVHPGKGMQILSSDLLK